MTGKTFLPLRVSLSSDQTMIFLPPRVSLSFELPLHTKTQGRCKKKTLFDKYPGQFPDQDPGPLDVTQKTLF
jgi:hypothetical protein